MFNNEIIPSQLTEPNYVKFDVFNKKALDFLKPRQNDTEIKYLFNLLEHHWDRGNRFVIEMESMLYTCESCRGYLVYLKDLAAKSGKTIEIKVIAHQDAPNIGELKKLIN